MAPHPGSRALSPAAGWLGDDGSGRGIDTCWLQGEQGRPLPSPHSFCRSVIQPVIHSFSQSPKAQPLCHCQGSSQGDMALALGEITDKDLHYNKAGSTAVLGGRVLGLGHLTQPEAERIAKGLGWRRDNTTAAGEGLVFTQPLPRTTLCKLLVSP